MNTLYKIYILFIISGIFFIAGCSYSKRFYHTEYPYRDIIIKKHTDIWFTIKSKRYYSLLTHPCPVERSNGLILLIPGRGGNTSDWQFYAKFLTDRNYHVWIPDYPGHGRSEGTPNHRRVYKRVHHMIKEVVEADSLQTLPKAVWGISLGANLAVKIAKEFTPFISGLIIDSGCTSFEDMAIETYGKENIMVRLAVSSPYPAEKNISKLKEMNLLLIHSPNDTIMPYAMGRKLYREASCNKYFWEVDSRHGYAIADSTERYIQLIGRLFDNDKDLKRKE